MKVYLVVKTLGIYSEFYDVEVFYDRKSAEDYINDCDNSDSEWDFSFHIHERELY